MKSEKSTSENFKSTSENFKSTSEKKNSRSAFDPFLKSKIKFLKCYFGLLR
jgi:hypothetical protein